MSANFSKLVRKVVADSVSQDWEEARLEWELDPSNQKTDKTCSSQCVCGQEGLKHCYQIRNKFNGKTIHWIGSTCINQFKSQELSSQLNGLANLEARLQKLLALAENTGKTEKIEMNDATANIFSEVLLLGFYNAGWFTNAQYEKQHGHPEPDYVSRSRYEMFLKAKRGKKFRSEHTRQVSYIMEHYIYPRLRLAWLERKHTGHIDLSQFDYLTPPADDIMVNLDSFQIAQGSSVCTN